MGKLVISASSEASHRGPRALPSALTEHYQGFDVYHGQQEGGETCIFTLPDQVGDYLLRKFITYLLQCNWQHKT